MISRERILAAIQHKEGNCIPFYLGGPPSSGKSIVVHQDLFKYLKIQSLNAHVYDLVQEVVLPEVELLYLGRGFNSGQNYLYELELIKGYPGFYSIWFEDQPQRDNSWLAYNNQGEIIGRMAVGATFFGQTIFTCLDAYSKDSYQLGTVMNNTVWEDFGFSTWDWKDMEDSWTIVSNKMLNSKVSVKGFQPDSKIFFKDMIEYAIDDLNIQVDRSIEISLEPWEIVYINIK